MVVPKVTPEPEMTIPTIRAPDVTADTVRVVPTTAPVTLTDADGTALNPVGQ